MEAIIGRVLLVLSLAAVACTAQVSNPNNQEPQQSGEQAETDLAVSVDRNTGSPVLVASYRWTGPAPLPSGATDIEYHLAQDSVFHRGASIAGFAYSADDGRSWIAPGKIRPPFVAFPILWGDARLSVDRRHPYTIAMINLAVSDQEFRSALGYDGTTDSLPRNPTSQSEGTNPPQCMVIPGQKNCDLIDSVCVSVSTDAGRSFPTPSCHQERRCNQANNACTVDSDCAGPGERCTPRQTDQCSVAFDSNEEPIAAFWESDEIVPFVHDHLELYRLLPSVQGPIWTPLRLDPQVTARYFPKVRSDRIGRVWMAASTTNGTTAGGIQLCRVDPGSNVCSFVAEVTSGIDTLNPQPVLTVPNVPNVQNFAVRVGQAIDFAVNVTGPNNATDLRFVYQHTGAPVAIHVLQCSLDDANPTPACAEHPEWSTDGVGQDTVQPTISLVDRSAAPDGTDVTWDYAFITGPNPNLPSPNPPYAIAWNRAMQSGGGPTRINEELPPDICVAQYPFGWYWGDFIGFAGFRDPRTGLFAHIATWSSDNYQGCNPNNIWQGDSLHVAASSWTDLTQ